MRTDVDDALRLHHHRTKAFKTISARIVFHARLDEHASARALVPRVLGRGTAQFPSLREFQTELDRQFGASLAGDARKIGDRQLIQYRSDWVMDRLADAPVTRNMASLIAGYLHEPSGFDQDGVVEHERKMMVDEAESVVDDKGRYARHRLVEEMCRGEAFARPSIGRADEIRALDAAEPKAAHAALLARAPVDVFLVGDIAARDARRFVKELRLAGRKAGSIPRTKRRRPSRVRTVKEREDIAQAKLAMGFRTRIRPDSPLVPALLLMNALFGGTAVGKLFKVVREQESLCYSIGSSTERTKGLLLVHAGIETANYQKTRRLVLKQLQALQRGDVTSQNLEQARSMLLNGFRSLRDSPGALIDFALERTINAQPVDLDGLLDELSTVTLGSVARAARTVELDTVYFLGS